MSEQPEGTVTMTSAEAGWLDRLAARQARAQKSYLQKVHGRSKYVPHQNGREKARRLRRRDA